jgi:PIN domain nuclease of toxin-antitoxin system
VRLLLDTHVALWWLNEPSLLRPDARTTLEDGENETFLSAASIWEAAIKESLGRFEPPAPLHESAAKTGLVELPISWAHARSAAALPRLHADPFDRMLVAQAHLEGLVLVTRDRAVLQYDVATMPA